jgi:hypothetical protein
MAGLAAAAVLTWLAQAPDDSHRRMLDVAPAILAMYNDVASDVTDMVVCIDVAEDITVVDVSCRKDLMLHADVSKPKAFGLLASALADYEAVYGIKAAEAVAADFSSASQPRNRRKLMLRRV